MPNYREDLRRIKKYETMETLSAGDAIIVDSIRVNYLTTPDKRRYTELSNRAKSLLLAYFESERSEFLNEAKKSNKISPSTEDCKNWSLLHYYLRHIKNDDTSNIEKIKADGEKLWDDAQRFLNGPIPKRMEELISKMYEKNNL